jgi:hypothetical protein
MGMFLPQNWHFATVMVEFQAFSLIPKQWKEILPFRSSSRIQSTPVDAGTPKDPT